MSRSESWLARTSSGESGSTIILEIVIQLLTVVPYTGLGRRMRRWLQESLQAGSPLRMCGKEEHGSATGRNLCL